MSTQCACYTDGALATLIVFYVESVIRSDYQLFFTGNHGVVRQGMTSPWIPDGWSWGGVVSDHCPVWVEFYVDKDMDSGVVRELEGITLTAAPGSLLTTEAAAGVSATAPEP